MGQIPHQMVNCAYNIIGQNVIEKYERQTRDVRHATDIPEIIYCCAAISKRRHHPVSEEVNQHKKADLMPLASMPLAQAYVPMQSFESVFPAEEGIRKGTIFPSLYKPYFKRGE